MTVRPADDEVLSAYPSAGIDHDNIELYRGLLARRLMLNRCRQCRAWHHPPRSLCPACWSADVAPEESIGRGVVYMLTTLHPHGSVSNVDRPIVTVDLDDQPALRFTAPLTDATADEVTPGQAVALCWIDRDGAPVPAFRLLR